MEPNRRLRHGQGTGARRADEAPEHLSQEGYGCCCHRGAPGLGDTEEEDTEEEDKEEEAGRRGGSAGGGGTGFGGGSAAEAGRRGGSAAATAAGTHVSGGPCGAG